MPVSLMCILPLLAAIFLSQPVSGQGGHSYREFKRDDCRRMQRSLDRQPDYVHLVPGADGMHLYLAFNDSVWMEQVFSAEKEDRWERLLGINQRSMGMKLLSADYFQCENTPGRNTDNYLWYSTPMSWSDMQEAMEVNDGYYTIYMGRIPDEFRHKPYDIGLVFSRKNRICQEPWMRRIEAHDFRIIPAPLLADTLLFPGDSIRFPKDNLPIITHKAFSTSVLFPKDQTSYDRGQIDEFLQQLPLQQYEPLDAHLQAWASVEGPENRNVELYNRRAEVILEQVKAFMPELQYFQCEVDENWDAFFKDVRLTSHASLIRQPRDTIRRRLYQTPLSQELEPLLANHRKTTLTITLQQEMLPARSTLQEMTAFFVQTLENKDLNSALRIQNKIFERMQQETLSDGFPTSLPFPDTLPFVSVFNRLYLYRYHMNLAGLTETWELFSQLSDVFPNQAWLHYNLAELSFRRWYSGDTMLSEREMLRHMEALTAFPDIPKPALHRMWLNYHKTMAHETQLQRNITARNRHLAAIRRLYPEAALSPDELISMASFLTAYGRQDVAEQMLRPMARAQYPDPDILFYYLNLTLTQERLRSTRWYRELLEYARAENPLRFCRLFVPLSSGGNGISGLFASHLLELYCEQCLEILQSAN